MLNFLQLGLTALMASHNVMAADYGTYRLLNDIPNKTHAQNIEIIKKQSRYLLQALKNKSLAAVQKALQQGADPNALDSSKRPALMLAINSGRLELLEELLKTRSIEVDITDPTLHHCTALYLAASQGQIDFVEALLTARANPKQACDNSELPLQVAARHGHSEVTRALLAAGADPKQARNDGVVPLHAAAQNNHPDIVLILLEAKADLNPRVHNTGETPLLLAAYNGHADATKVLLAAGANPNLALKDGITPLFFAAQQGHLEVVKLLLQTLGIEKNIVWQEYNRTPMMAAAIYGHWKIVVLLGMAGADPKVVEQNGNYDGLSVEDLIEKTRSKP